MKARKVGRKPKISKVEMAIAFEDIEAGVPTKIIAKNLGINWSTLRHAIPKAKARGFEACA